MRVAVEVLINAAKRDVWRVVTDIENAAVTISGIDRIEILERPDQGFTGLKWRETRTLFGKTATEVIQITDSVDGEYYDTEARSHGSVYRSKISVSEADGDTSLRMDFRAEPISVGARIVSILLGFTFKRATAKALLQDLKDVKAIVEVKRSATAHT